MRGRIAVGQRAVAGRRDHRAVAHDHAADRHLAGVLRLARLVQRHVHEGRHSTPRSAQPCIKAWMPGIKPGMTKTDERSDRPKAGHHRGRPFRGKRLKTTLPKPAVDVPLPQAKAAERIAKVMARAGLASRREAEAWIAAGPRLGQRRENHARRRSTSPQRTRSRSTASRCRSASARGCSCSTSRAASSPPTPTPTAARPSSARCRRTCRAWSASAGSTSTPRACCC